MNTRRLRQTPEIVPIQQFSANFAPTFRIIAAVNHPRLHSVRSIPPREHQRSARLHRMAAHKRGAMLAHRNRPRLFFPRATGILAAKENRHRRTQARAATKPLPRLRHAAKKSLETALRRYVGQAIILNEPTSLLSTC